MRCDGKRRSRRLGLNALRTVAGLLALAWLATAAIAKCVRELPYLVQADTYDVIDTRNPVNLTGNHLVGTAQLRAACDGVFRNGFE